jgi:hypothetical protein
MRSNIADFSKKAIKTRWLVAWLCTDVRKPRWHSWIARPPPKGKVRGSNPLRGANLRPSKYADAPIDKSAALYHPKIHQA